MFSGRPGGAIPLDLITVTLASLFAGFVDAIVGGGGLILVPALFSVFPNAAPATLFGTNKGAAVWGTAWATAQFAKKVSMRWAALLGRHHTPRFSGRTEALVASAIGLVIGFYDGFFGPGTGSFFVFLLVRLLGYDFLSASASAKLLNTATNSAALVLFAFTGHVWWHIAAVMAVANVVGSLLGTRLALKHGASFVRVVFMAVVSVLILKTGYDGLLR